MIDGLGRVGAGRVEPTRVALDKTQASAKTGDALAQGASGAPATAAAALAQSGPPVDSAKVAAIRTAIAEGRYPVDADKIAERMIALDLPERFGA